MAEPSEKEKKLAEVKKMMRSVLMGEKEGVIYHKLPGLYRETVFEEIPYRKCGFPTLESMIAAMPDTVQIGMNQNGEKIYRGVADSATAHIQKMVNAQKSNKRRPAKRGAPYKALMSKRPSYMSSKPPTMMKKKPKQSKSPWGKSTTSFAPAPRPMNPSYQPRQPSPSFRPPPQRYNSAPNAQTGYHPQAYRSHKLKNGQTNGHKNGHKTESARPSWKPEGENTFQSAKAAAASASGTSSTAEKSEKKSKWDPIDAPPRDLRERLSRQVNSAKHGFASSSSSSPPSSQSSSGKENYRGMLSMYHSNQGLPGELSFSTVALKEGYVSSVCIKGETYGSIHVYRTRHDAEREAAKNACEELGILHSPRTPAGPSRPSSDCTPEIKNRIKEIVQSRPNGLWGNRLPIEYKERYREEAPREILDWAKAMKDIVRCESVSGTERVILYPNAARSLEQIKPANLPKPGMRIEVAGTFLIDPSEIYVQLTANTEIIIKISTGLQECAKKPLEDAEVGEFCIAKYQEDGQWYRGLIKERIAHNFKVLYVDFGNTERVSAGQVCQILKAHAQYPAMAFRCALHNIYSVTNPWPKTVRTELERMMNASITMDVMEVKDDCCWVDMYLDDERQSVNEDLVNRGLASPYPLPPEPETLLLPEDEEWEVIVTYVRSTTDIRVRLLGDQYSVRLYALEKELERRCTERLPFRYVPRSICAVKDADDGTMARARIINTRSNKMVDVLYVDHGDSETVPLSQLYKLPPSLNTLPYQAVPCKLSGLEPYERDEAVLARLSDLTKTRMTLIAAVDEKLEKVSITLWDVSSDEDINVNAQVAEVLNMAQLKPKLPPVGLRVEGFVMTIKPDGRIFLILQGPGLEQLEELHEEMNKIYSSKPDKDGGTPTKDTSATSLFISRPQEGQLVAAVFEDESGNSTWYRALIQEVLPARRVKVFYVDYGNMDELSYSKLRAPAKVTKYMEHLPYQAVEVMLNGFPPEDGESVTVEDLNDLLHNEDEQQVPVHIEVIKAEEGELPVVDLYMEREDEEGRLVEGLVIQWAEELGIECSEGSSVGDVTDEHRNLQDCIPEQGDWRVVDEINESQTSQHDAMERLGPHGEPQDSSISRHEPQDSSISRHEPQDSSISRHEPQDSSISRHEPQDSSVSGNEPQDTPDTQYEPRGSSDSSTSQNGHASGSSVSQSEPQDTSAEPYGSSLSHSEPDMSFRSSVPSASENESVFFSNTPSQGQSDFSSSFPRSSESTGDSSEMHENQEPEVVGLTQGIESVSLATGASCLKSPASSQGTGYLSADSPTSSDYVTSNEQSVYCSPNSEPTGIEPTALEHPNAIYNAPNPEEAGVVFNSGLEPATSDPSTPQAVASNLDPNAAEYRSLSQQQAAAAVVEAEAMLAASVEPCVALPPLPLPDSGDKVLVTWADDPHNFRCVPYASLPSMQALNGDMQDFYTANLQDYRVQSVLPHGFYAGLFNQMWYRVQVRNVLPEQVSVMFVDYGDCSIIPLYDLCYLAPHHRTLPAQSIRAKLLGVAPPQHDGEWPEECRARLQELILEQPMTAFTYGRPDDKGFLLMTLVAEAAEGGSAFIHKVLISEGLAARDA